MARLSGSVEYALHCLLWLVDADAPPSARDLADLQGISASFLAKILPRLEKAGIVRSTGGLRGGYALARPAGAISVFDVVRALEGDRPLFECREIRGRCALFGERPPGWATGGVCAIHAVMLGAEKAWRDSLSAHTLADLARTVAGKAPGSFGDEVRAWLQDRHRARPRQPQSRGRRRATGGRARA